jgi:hypothetical protein
LTCHNLTPECGGIQLLRRDNGHVNKSGATFGSRQHGGPMHTDISLAIAGLGSGGAIALMTLGLVVIYRAREY